MSNDKEDEEFFRDYPDRRSRIRAPRLERVIGKARAVRFEYECLAEFRSLGEHDKDRRRIILWRVPPDNRYYDAVRQPILKIPFLLFGDETVEDRDDILLPIIDEIMLDALRRQK